MINFNLSETKPLDNDFVVKTGLIFRAGDYPDKKFQMSPEEIIVAESEFQSAPLDIEHNKSIFDGKLGELKAIKASEDGNNLYGAAVIPKWLNDVIGTDPIKVSCTWNRESKKLEKLALVTNPRVSDAALMAAFSKHEITQGKPTEEVVTEFLTWFAETSDKDQTWDGQDLLQSIHNMAARSGAVCTKAEMSTEDFVSKDEAKGIQAIHDLTIKKGAKCNFKDSMRSYYSEDISENNKNGVNMNLKEKLLELINSFKDEASDISDNAESVENKQTPNNEVKELEAKVAEYKNQLDALKSEKDALEADKAKAELQKQVEELKEKVANETASNFANEMVISEKLLPTEVNSFVALFKQLAKDDENSEVVFGNDTKGRLEALKNFIAQRTVTKLTDEKLADAVVLSAETANEAVDLKKVAEDQVTAYLASRKK